MPKRISELDLIQGCKKADRLAQRQVYEQYARRMYAVCLRYVRQEMEAEEVLTSGFLKVFAKIDQFKIEGSFEGWIRRIMVNESLNHLRKQRLMYAEVEIEQVADTMSYSVNESDYTAEELLYIIEQLPVGYRTVFNLYAIEGYAHKEIGEMLNISENTSKSQLSRARTWLQNYLQNHNETPIAINN
jgi:RNA polymerase sigma-70 factor (ECF subfamily)